MSFFHIAAMQRKRYDFGGALSLNGTTQYGRLQNLSGVALPASYSLLITCRPGRQPNTTEIVFNNSTGTTNGWSVRFQYDAGLPTGTAQPHLYWLNATGSVQKIAGAVVRVGEVCQLLMTKSGTGTSTVMRFYVNGVLAGSLTGGVCAAVGTWSTVTTGTSHGPLIGLLLSGSYFQGQIAELDLMADALTYDDARKLWNGGRGSFWRDSALASIPSELRLKFEETSGSTANDSSGQTPATPRNLTLINSPTFVTF